MTIIYYVGISCPLCDLLNNVTGFILCQLRIAYFGQLLLLPHCISQLLFMSLTGASSQLKRTELAKMKSMSSLMHRQELIEAARKTFCYRSEVIAKTKTTFATCVASIPCYITVPGIVSY
jgi:hypothetical protein